jgi:TolB-like protein
MCARVELVARICDAVHHAHERGIVHRDLKPGNVLVGPDGQPKVVDFGVAQVRGAAVALSTVATAAGELVGTVPYMSPEQIAGAPGRVDAASDTYAIGVILFRLLTGRLPFAGDEPSLPELARRIAEEEPPRLGQIDPTLGGDLERIVACALAKDRAHRYASAAAFAADLRRWLAGTAIVAAREPAASRVRRVLMRRRRAIGAGMTIAVLAGALAWMGVRDRTRIGPATVPPGKIMLAVLPLENLTGSEEQQLFIEGLHEEIISRLGRLQPQRLGVIARTSMLRYRETTRSIAEIGHELGADYVLEGSVRQDGRRVRVTAQLIQANDQTHVWAETFERELGDLFSVQVGIGAGVAEALTVDVLPEALATVDRRAQLSADAYAAFRRGQYFFERRALDHPANTRRAVDHFRAVVEAAPQFAEGHAALAEAYRYLAVYAGAAERSILREQAFDAISRALAIDRALPAALVALGSLRIDDYDRSGGFAAFREAIQYDPNLAEARLRYANPSGVCRPSSRGGHGDSRGAAARSAQSDGQGLRLLRLPGSQAAGPGRGLAELAPDSPAHAPLAASSGRCATIAPAPWHAFRTSRRGWRSRTRRRTPIPSDTSSDAADRRLRWLDG